MPCRYDFVIAGAPLDALTLALQRDNGVIVAPRAATAYLPRMGATPAVHPGGLVALLPGPEPAPALEMVACRLGSRRVVGAGAEPLAELLDRLRGVLPETLRPAVALVYGDGGHDLPPLVEGDSVACWWEVRDMLSDAALDRLRPLAERLADEPGAFQGLQFYTRSADQVIPPRLAAIHDALGWPPSATLTRI